MISWNNSKANFWKLIAKLSNLLGFLILVLISLRHYLLGWWSYTHCTCGGKLIKIDSILPLVLNQIKCLYRALNWTRHNDHDEFLARFFCSGYRINFFFFSTMGSLKKLFPTSDTKLNQFSILISSVALQ
jgi:hypothetical protein